MGPIPGRLPERTGRARRGAQWDRPLVIGRHVARTWGSVDNIGKAFVSCPMRCTVGRCFFSPPVAILETRAQLRLSTCCRLEAGGVANTRTMAKSNPEIWKRPLSSTPNSCSAGLAGVTRHHATPEPKLHKRATRRRKASAVFCGVGRSINLDLDLEVTS